MPVRIGTIPARWSDRRASGYAGAMTEPKDDTVRSMIEQAHEEIVEDSDTTDEKRTRETAK